MEHIISFLRDETSTLNQFNIDITGITYPDPNYYVDRKNSSIYCIEYVISGEGTVEVGNEVFHPSKGDVYILPLGYNHRYYSSRQNPWKKIWVNVNGPLCDALIRIYHLENIRFIQYLDLYDLFKEFLSICEQKENPLHDTQHQCSIVFHKIISKISMHLYGTPVAHSTVAYRVKDYIHKNIYDKLTIKDIADIACLSTSQLNRVFKRAFNQTPYEYILIHKVETAKTLLTNTNMSIKEIAFQINFADEHYFSNFFKERVGVSPSEYANRRIKREL